MSEISREMAIEGIERAAHKDAFEDNHEEIFKRAVEKHGALPQIGMLYEEMGELMTAINQWIRGRVPVETVAEEMADVCVMLHQLQFAVEVLTSGKTSAESFADISDVYFEQKVERLALRIGEDNRP